MLSQVSTRVQTSPKTCGVDDGGGATLAGLNSGTFRIIVIIGVILGLCRDNGKENGSYYLGFRV